MWELIVQNTKIDYCYFENIRTLKDIFKSFVVEADIRNS